MFLYKAVINGQVAWWNLRYTVTLVAITYVHTIIVISILLCAYFGQNTQKHTQIHRGDGVAQLVER